jgi:integrase/recombinase XerD
MARIPPKKMAKQIAGQLRKQNPDPNYVKKVFQYVRENLGLKGGTVTPRHLPDLMTKEELKHLYKAVWKAFNRMHMVMLKLILYTGIRNEELVNLRLNDVDLEATRIRIERENDDMVRVVLFPLYFREELRDYIRIQHDKGAFYLFESNRKSKFSTRWIREIIKQYAKKAGIAKQINPDLLRHQLLSYLRGRGIMDAKIQLISGDGLEINKGLNLSDVEKEYKDAMDDFLIK